MAKIFRPWIEKTEVMSEKLEIANQDSTITTTMLHNQLEDNEITKEMKYKSVKENMKRRSEKYLQRKWRSETKNDNEISKTHWITPLPLGAGGISDLSSWDINSSPELLETVLSQGITPSLVEEYAHLLTYQHKQVNERSKKQRPKKFRCPHCQVAFSNNGQLKGHIRIHTGERPFKCDAESCGKSFTRNEELTRHRRIHSGLRPFPCPECGKRFGRKDHLKKHIRTHFQQRYQLIPILPSHYPYMYGF